MKPPLPVFAIAFVLGALISAPLADDVRLLVSAGIVIVCAVVASRRFGPWQLRAALLATLAFATINGMLHERLHQHVTESRTQRFTATVIDRATTVDGTPKYTLALERGLTVSAVTSGQAQVGERVVVRGRLEPFDEARNPGEPSERVLQRERGIDGEIQSAAIAARQPSASTDVRGVLARLHHAALETLRAQLGEPGASIVAGELWGERSALPPDLRADFQESGTVHILVTAGLHVGLIAALVAAVLSRFSLPRWCACGITIAVLWLFVLWSGAQLPAVRAASMASAALIARAGGAAAMSWNALALAAIAIAIFRPESVATPSFALSFACVGTIFSLARPIDRWIEGATSIPARLREVVALSSAAQIGTWPIGAAVFLQFAPYAIFANMAIVPCVPITMLLGMAELATQRCVPLAQAFANLNGWLLAWTVAVIRCVGALPAASIPMTPAPTVCIALYLATIVAIPALMLRSMRTLAAAAIVVSVSLVLWPPDWPDGLLHVIVLDVGQADGIVVQTPAGHVYEIDAGGRLERGPQSDASSAELVGERIVVPYLLRHGIHGVDAMILSHPHGDHAGGIAPVLRKLRVAEFADGGQIYGGHAYHDALDVARSESVPMVYPRAGGIWRSDDGVTLQFIGPSIPFIGGKNAINDNSVAFVLQYRHFRMLFTGDAGSAAEQRFLDEGVALHADVLKVGHHGSAYGSTPAFIAAVAPRYAIVSVGRHNMFGHPAPSTIETLKRFGATLYRTDENGAVSITSDGTRLGVTAMLGP